ncbi:MAG: flippase [Solobacterium sp.]|nr:flippase [Solobacterium sp.]
MNRLLKNTSWIIFNQVFQMLVSFIVGLLTIRYLGPSNYGSITYIASYITFFSAVTLMGLDTVVVNRLVQYKERDGEVVYSAILLRCIMSLVCMGLLALLVKLVDAGDEELFLVAILSSFELLFKSFGTIGFYYQYKLESKKTTLADMVAFTLASLFRIWLLVTHKSVYWFAFYNSLLYLFIALFYVPMFHQDCVHKKTATLAMMKELLHACMPYFFSGIMIALYTQVDRIMIKHLLDSKAQVGLYSAAVVICHLVSFVPNSISLSARPVLMAMKQQESKDYMLRVTQVVASIIWFSIAYALFITLFAPIIIGRLYGDAYLPVINVLRLLVWCTIFENLTKIRDMWLIGENLSRYVTLFSALGTILNILLNYVFIQSIGIIGAALATVLTQLCVTLIVPMFFDTTKPFSMCIVDGLRLKNIKLKVLINEIIGSVLGKGGEVHD